jgi:hypothetical protein
MAQVHQLSNIDYDHRATHCGLCRRTVAIVYWYARRRSLCEIEYHESLIRRLRTSLDSAHCARARSPSEGATKPEDDIETAIEFFYRVPADGEKPTAI